MLFKETNRSGASWRSYGYEKSTAIDFSWWLGHFQTGRSFKEEKCFEFRGNGWSHEVSGFVCCHCIVYCTFPSKSIYLLDEVGREGGSHHWKFQTGFKGCCQGMPVPGASQLELFAAALVLLKVGKAESAGWEYFFMPSCNPSCACWKFEESVSERQDCVSRMWVPH